MAADPLDVRLARLEGSYEQIDRRLATIEGDIRELRTGTDKHFRELRAATDEHFREQHVWADEHFREQRAGMDEHFRFLISQINRQMYWLAGILVTSLGSLAVSLLILLLPR